MPTRYTATNPFKRNAEKHRALTATIRQERAQSAAQYAIRTQTAAEAILNRTPTR